MLQICVIKQVIIDRKLKFNKHVTNFCHEANKKIQALQTVFPNMPVTQRKLLMNPNILSQFGHWPLVWVNHSRVLIYLFFLFYYPPYLLSFIIFYTSYMT